jgi:hypothetical protein
MPDINTIRIVLDNLNCVSVSEVGTITTPPRMRAADLRELLRRAGNLIANAHNRLGDVAEAVTMTELEQEDE